MEVVTNIYGWDAERFQIHAPSLALKIIIQSEVYEMSHDSTYYTRNDDEVYAQLRNNLNESKSTFLLYNGALETDEDPADYSTPIRAVRIA